MDGAQTHRGRFQKGHDPRRHTFTHEECVKGGVEGYRAATESLLRRFPGCDPHFLMCAIIGSRPWHTLPQVRDLALREQPLTDAEASAAFAAK